MREWSIFDRNPIIFKTKERRREGEIPSSVADTKDTFCELILISIFFNLSHQIICLFSWLLFLVSQIVNSNGPSKQADNSFFF